MKPAELLLLVIIFTFMYFADSLTCYKGFKFIRGQSFGTETEECESDSAYCYNITAEAAVLINVMKAGCSTYRCMLSRNACRSTTFQGVPVSFCCCNNADLCNLKD
uniref:Activin_recp domain-containing protein n=1 Tax=Parascaris univalens TaxID=6257 RepID=A0A915BQD3_PARUN